MARLQAWFEARHDDFRKQAKETNMRVRREIDERDGAAVLYAMVFHDGTKTPSTASGIFGHGDLPWALQET